MTDEINTNEVVDDAQAEAPAGPFTQTAQIGIKI